MRKLDGTPFKVFTPFRNAWLDHGWRKQAGTDPSTLDWIKPDHSAKIPAVKEKLPDAGKLWENYDRKFDRMRHDNDEELFEAWTQGRTGYPIVDAGMRQLLQEGFMLRPWSGLDVEGVVERDVPAGGDEQGECPSTAGRVAIWSTDSRRATSRSSIRVILSQRSSE